MKVSAFAFRLALISGLFNTVSGECDGTLTEDKITQLDLSHSTVETNTLHLKDGEIRYKNVGLFENKPLDLVVTITSGDYTDIVQTWMDRKKIAPNGNGKGKDKTENGEEGKFGNINLQTVEGKPKSGEGNFKMCIVEQGTYTPVTLEQFSWTVYDLDERGVDILNKKKVVIKEKLIIDAGQAQVYQLVNTAAYPTQVKLSCEDGSPASLTQTCPAGVRTIFHSSEGGVGKDNPSDPANLTDLQKQRSVSFTFVNKSCWTFTYDHYCSVDQPEYTGGIEQCKKYTGGNFLFAGESEQIIEEGECQEPPPPPPTLSPSHTPTVSPSHDPTGTPTNDPSGSPTISPSHNPTSNPSGSPTRKPTTLSPKNSSSLPPSACPDDVTIIKTVGITEIDAGQAVRILEQVKTSVKVRLYQGWTSTTSSVDRIYYTYKHSSFSQKCHVVEDVTGLVNYEDITIQCHHTKAFARLDICVVDSGGALDPEGDNAEIAQCCNPNLPEETPTVCYKFVIHCASVCADADADADADAVE